MPFEGALRSSGDRPGSYRGPPGDAAVICAATPTFTAFVGSSCGPLVSARQPGFEHRFPTREAKSLLTASEKSSPIGI